MEYADEGGKNNLSVFIDSLVYISIFGVFFYLIYVQAFSSTYIAEFQAHIVLLERFVANPFTSETVHPGFHLTTYFLSKISRLSYRYAGILVISSVVVLTAWMTRKLLIKNLGKYYADSWLFLISIFLLFFSSIYLPFFNQNFYLGQWSGNFYAVPTQVMIKPFALTGFLMFMAFYNNEKIAHWRFFGIFTALIFLASVIVKPSFIFVFLPAVATFVLLKRKTELNKCLRLIYFVLPSILFLLLQFWGNFIAGSGQGIRLVFFDVWRMYSPNVIFSVFLAIAFPLLILIFRFQHSIKNDYFVLSWLMWFFSLLEFAFLAEVRNFNAANFSWSYSLSLWLLYIFSTIEFLSWLKTDSSVSGQYRWKITTASVVFSLHLVSGVAYFIKQLLGLGYQ